ncbi:hypothetical protein ACAZ27_00280 [Akkermansia muciniphila]|jgi:hypothetical protein|uniref:Replisome organizer n=1 Tax=Myoviridae sp. ctZYN8 TaxID=2825128 RepID=A0A8S5UA50_9CAUD|nr:hypothetical protein CXU18_00270 [Akkermansia muciniphila]DAF91361.1 MAG TPA: replisome organizer [Myoviridae sp. ctZYN8]DAJ78819.1 MAG TPA: replisome organizer [Caudoviricetes sp.]
MPNRIIREGIITSEAVNSLSWEAEIFYRRLLSVVDDFGRFDARPSVLRSALYPLKLDSMREDSVQRCLKSCEAARLVVLYSVEGKEYLEVTNFRQQVRSKKSKYPTPDAHMHSTCTADDRQTDSKIEKYITDRELQELHSTCLADAQHMRTKTESETETNNTPLPPPCTVEEVEAHLRAAAFAGRVRLAPDQIPDCATAYISKRDLTDWKRGEIPITAAKWKSDSINFAVSYSANHPAQPGTDKDPYSNLEEL